MTSVKVEVTPVENRNTSEQTSQGKLPDAKVDAIREEIKNSSSQSMSADAIELVAGETRLNPEQLMKMYMLGKLTTGQLAFELRKYNDVVADTIIKDGKQNFTKVIDYKGVSRASVSNPGADLRPSDDAEVKADPKDAKNAKKEAGDTDNEKKKRDLEKKEDQLKEKEALQQIRIIQAVNKVNEEQKATHVDIDTKKKMHEKEEEKQIQESLSHEDSLGKIMNKSALRDRLRKNIGDEIRQELEKAKTGPTQGSR